MMCEGLCVPRSGSSLSASLRGVPTKVCRLAVASRGKVLTKRFVCRGWSRAWCSGGGLVGVVPLSLFFTKVALFSYSGRDAGGLSAGSRGIGLGGGRILDVTCSSTGRLASGSVFGVMDSFTGVGGGNMDEDADTSFGVAGEACVGGRKRFRGGRVTSQATLPRSSVVSRVYRIRFRGSAMGKLTMMTAGTRLPSVVTFVPGGNGSSTVRLDKTGRLLCTTGTDCLCGTVGAGRLMSSLGRPALRGVDGGLGVPVGRVGCRGVRSGVVLASACSSESATMRNPPRKVRGLPSSVSPLIGAG